MLRRSLRNGTDRLRQRVLQPVDPHRAACGRVPQQPLALRFVKELGNPGGVEQPTSPDRAREQRTRRRPILMEPERNVTEARDAERRRCELLAYCAAENSEVADRGE